MQDRKRPTIEDAFLPQEEPANAAETAYFDGLFVIWVGNRFDDLYHPINGVRAMRLRGKPEYDHDELATLIASIEEPGPDFEDLVGQ